MLDIDDSKFPRSWSEMSFDYKLAFIHHGAMMLMMVLSSTMSKRSAVFLILLWAAVLVRLSIGNRRAKKWAWPGANSKDILRAAMSLLLGGFFMGAMLINFTLDGAVLIPIAAGVAGLVLTGVLQNLNALAATEKEFAASCEGRRPEPPPLDEQPAWKKTLRAVLTACFLGAWICGVGSFWLHGLAMRRSSPVPTEEATVAYNDHGKTVYVPRNLDRIRSRLEKTAGAAVPFVLISFLFAQFVLGVKMIPHAKSFSELWKEKPWNRKV